MGCVGNRMKGIVPRPSKDLLMRKSSLVSGGRVLGGTSVIILTATVRPGPSIHGVTAVLATDVSAGGFLARTRTGLHPMRSPATNVFLSNMYRKPGSVPRAITRTNTTTIGTVNLLTGSGLAAGPYATGSSRLLYGKYSAYTGIYPCKTVSCRSGRMGSRNVHRAEEMTIMGATLYRKYNTYAMTYPSNTVSLRNFSGERVVTRMSTVYQ